MSLIKTILSLKSKMDPTLLFLLGLRDLVMVPILIIGIRANRGGWNRNERQIFPESQFRMLQPKEPLPSSHRDLSAHSSIMIEDSGLIKIGETSTLILHACDDCSSFSCCSEQAKAQRFSQIEIPFLRLDTYMKRNSFGQPEIVRIDADSLDLDVFQGAADNLLQADVVSIETLVSNSIIPTLTSR